MPAAEPRTDHHGRADRGSAAQHGSFAVRTLCANLPMKVAPSSSSLTSSKNCGRSATLPRVMRQGKVVATTDPQAVSADALARLMIGRSMPHAERSGSPPAAGEAQLVVEDLSTVPTEPHIVPLDHVTLTAKAGEIVGIAGVSGNGQEELVRLLSGEVQLTEFSSAAFATGLHCDWRTRRFRPAAAWSCLRSGRTLGTRSRRLPLTCAQCTIDRTAG